jgi:hypothetical protein
MRRDSLLSHPSLCPADGVHLRSTVCYDAKNQLMPILMDVYNEGLEGAAKACEQRSQREEYGHAKAACFLDAEAIRELKQ